MLLLPPLLLRPRLPSPPLLLLMEGMGKGAHGEEQRHSGSSTRRSGKSESEDGEVIAHNLIFPPCSTPPFPSPQTARVAMQAAVSSSVAAAAAKGAGDAAVARTREYAVEMERIRFTSSGQLLPRVSSRAKLTAAIKNVESVASFIEKPWLPTSHIPFDIDYGFSRARCVWGSPPRRITTALRTPRAQHSLSRTARS